MKCLYPDKPCRFRDEKGFCRWSCPHDHPQTDCWLANECWGCPYLCIYDALEGRQAGPCPFRRELEEMLRGER